MVRRSLTPQPPLLYGEGEEKPHPPAPSPVRRGGGEPHPPAPSPVRRGGGEASPPSPLSCTERGRRREHPTGRCGPGPRSLPLSVQERGPGG
jgi:hypothetical protein